MPAWTFGHQRQCWKNGGREHCVDEDPVFRAMEADLFNLYPAVGEVNGDRSNFNCGMAAGVAPQCGQCTTRIDFQQKAAEPRSTCEPLLSPGHRLLELPAGRRENQELFSSETQAQVAGDTKAPHCK